MSSSKYSFQNLHIIREKSSFRINFTFEKISLKRGQRLSFLKYWILKKDEILTKFSAYPNNSKNSINFTFLIRSQNQVDKRSKSPESAPLSNCKLTKSVVLNRTMNIDWIDSCVASRGHTDRLSKEPWGIPKLFLVLVRVDDVGDVTLCNNQVTMHPGVSSCFF